MTVEGTEGSCTGAMKGCTWTASCTFAPDGAAPDAPHVTANYAYTFTESGLTGPVAVTMPAMKAIPAGCSGMSVVRGVRQ